MPTPTVCSHGYYLDQCALCHKRSHECDYGSCTASAIVVVMTRHEGRRACATHVEPIRRSSLATR